MKFARTINKYKYSISPWTKDGNIGDCIQSLAVENIYKKAGISPEDLFLINRDDVCSYSGPKVALIMQGWFTDYANVSHFPLSKDIFPIFIGFHLSPLNHTREKFIWRNIISEIKRFEPIGCRDRDTRDFLLKLEIKAYFSACLTLTFDKRENTFVDNGKIFIVDLDKKALSCIPMQILDKSDFSISHRYHFDEYPLTNKSAEDFEMKAREVLRRYKTEANLVITSKIHVAMPCIAMGIPVIFITDNPDNERFDVIDGIIPIYHYKDINQINWSPKAAEITELKNAIIGNAVAQIKKLQNKGDDSEPLHYRVKLEEVTAHLEKYHRIHKRPIAITIKRIKRDLRIRILWYIRRVLNFYTKF